MMTMLQLLLIKKEMQKELEFVVRLPENGDSEISLKEFH